MRYARQLAAASLLTMGSAVCAAPVHYSEAVSGDLAAVPTAAFTLGTGDNTFSGTTQLLLFHNGMHFDVDADSFAFTLVSGTQLEAISLSLRTTAFNVSSANDEFELCRGVGSCGLTAGDPLGAQTLDFLDRSSFAVDFEGALPLTSATYTLFNHAVGIAVSDPSIGVGTGWSADYEWDLVVAPVTPVPEPNTLWLVGLAAVAYCTRHGGRLTPRPRRLRTR